MSALSMDEAGQVLLALNDTCWPEVTVHAGAEFVVGVQQDGFTEYRFCGDLGFGGKFYSANGKWYVSTYPEDRTPERDAKIVAANVRLETLRELFRGTLK